MRNVGHDQSKQKNNSDALNEKSSEKCSDYNKSHIVQEIKSQRLNPTCTGLVTKDLQDWKKTTRASQNALKKRH